MNAATVAPGQRFTARQPCPVCDGHAHLPHGQARRCWGFLSADGAYVHCTRPEYAGALEPETAGSYAHRLAGVCRCGRRHGSGPTLEPATERRNGHATPRGDHATFKREPIIATYDYVDEAGTPLFSVGRTADKQFPQWRAGAGPREWGIRDTRRVLYHLPRVVAAVAADQTVYVVEGEKDVEAIERAGGVATCNPGGAGKWRAEYSACLRGATVVIVQDRDEPGRRHAAQVAASLASVGASVRIVEAAAGKDAADHLAAGHGLAELVAVEAAPLPDGAAPASHVAEDEDDARADARPRGSQGSRLVALAHARGVELWHTPDHEAWATLLVAGHREHVRLHARAAREWLARQLYEAEHVSAGSQAVQDALGTLAGEARFEGPEHAVHTRLAAHDGTIYLDLGRPAWDAVAITADGWTLGADPPVRFRRTRGLLPLPLPRPGGSVADLRPFVNVSSDEDWRLLLGALLAMLRPSGPYPVLVLHGEQGGAKSTTARLLRALVDPNSAPLRAEPRDAHGLMIAATNGWVVALDNVSHLPPWLSDALCRLSTGGGFSARELYTDDEETIFDAQRPAILTGIEAAATRGDLLDRALLVELPAIAEQQRQPEAALWAAFERARPALLGALLDAVAVGLRTLPNIHLERLPRMADFALWASACEPALGWERGSFMAAYSGNRATAHEQALDGSAIGPALRALLEARATWTGTASELLEALGQHASDQQQRGKGWPKSGRAVSGELKRLAPALRALGYTVTFHARTMRARLLTLEKRGNPPSSSSSSSCASSDEAFPHDGHDGPHDDDDDRGAPHDGPAIWNDGHDDSSTLFSEGCLPGTCPSCGRTLMGAERDRGVCVGCQPGAAEGAPVAVPGWGEL